MLKHSAAAYVDLIINQLVDYRKRQRGEESDSDLSLSKQYLSTLLNLIMTHNFCLDIKNSLKQQRTKYSSIMHRDIAAIVILEIVIIY